jgi:hypothetical protein
VCYAGGMKKSHAEVLLEQISSDVKAVLELVGAQPTLIDFHRLEGKVDNLGDRMDVVEAVAKDVSRDLAEHTSLPAHAAHGRA